MATMYRKILVTIDGSGLSAGAIPQAGMIASGTDAEVIVLQVIETVDALREQALRDFGSTDGDLTRLDTLAQEIYITRRGRALQDVEGAKSELQGSGVPNVRTAIVEGLAGNEILDFARQEGCDAIVMATRGHGGLGREIIGSVAEYVLRHVGPIAVVLVGPRARG